MNNTMKNLKDEIEGIMNEHSYKQDVRDFGKPATVTQYKATDLVEALTSLIEQEKERAIRKDREAIYKDIKSNYDISADEFFEQYLAERKG